MMLATVSGINRLPEPCHLTFRRFKRSSRLIQFFFQWFHNVLYQDTGGMLCVVHTHRLGIGFCLHRFRFRFPYRRPKRTYCYYRSHQTAAKHHVQNFADIHAIHFFYFWYIPIDRSHAATSKLGQAFFTPGNSPWPTILI